MVNPTQLSDKEFTAWMDRLVEARRNRQENKPRPYRQFRKPFLQRRGDGEETQWQQELKQKLKETEELNTEELICGNVQPRRRGMQVCLTRKTVQPDALPYDARAPRRGMHNKQHAEEGTTFPVSIRNLQKTIDSNTLMDMEATRSCMNYGTAYRLGKDQINNSTQCKWWEQMAVI